MKTKLKSKRQDNIFKRLYALQSESQTISFYSIIDTENDSHVQPVRFSPTNLVNVKWFIEKGGFGMDSWRLGGGGTKYSHKKGVMDIYWVSGWFVVMSDSTES